MRASLATVAVLLIIGVSAASAQDVHGGVRAGVHVADVSFSESDADADFGRRTGLVAGAFLVVPLSPSFAIQPEVLFSQKGTSGSQRGVTGELKLDYLDVPILGRFWARAGSRSTIHVFAGPSLNFRLRARVRGSFAGETSEQNIDDEIKAFDAGLVMGAGVQVGRLIVDGRYTWGVTNISKDEAEVTAKNRGLSLTAGIRF